jgi:hypothetical protein
MSTVAQIAKDIRRSPQYIPGAVAMHLAALGYSKTARRTTSATILTDIQNTEGDFTPDRVAEHLHSLDYSKGVRMTEAEVKEAFNRGTDRWVSEGYPTSDVELYWAEELGIKVISGTRIQGGV